MKYDSFPPEVSKELNYYVYRLVDPRNGNTFYVGKGKGDRVFAHIKAASDLNAFLNKENKGKGEDEKEDAVSLKISTIQAIKKAGLDVIHIIHRYGMTDREAFEVESALIDCYPGLTNIQSGHGSDRGAANSDALIDSLKRGTYDLYGRDDKYIIIKINDENLAANGGDYYETTRKYWRVNPDKANDYDYVFAVNNGIVKEIYCGCIWKRVEEAFEGKRSEFTGDKNNVPQEIHDYYVDKRIPDEFRKKGNASPVLYWP